LLLSGVQSGAYLSASQSDCGVALGSKGWVQLAELAAGQLPQVELLDEAIGMLPLLMGADGVMVPFRPESGKGRTVWQEVKVAVLARLGRRSNSNAPQLHQSP